MSAKQQKAAQKAAHKAYRELIDMEAHCRSETFTPDKNTARALRRAQWDYTDALHRRDRAFGE